MKQEAVDQALRNFEIQIQCSDLFNGARSPDLLGRLFLEARRLRIRIRSADAPRSLSKTDCEDLHEALKAGLLSRYKEVQPAAEAAYKAVTRKTAPKAKR